MLAYFVAHCRLLRQAGGQSIRGHRAKASRMTTDTESRPQHWREIVMFLVLAVVIWPFIAVAVVGGWGFLVWMWFAFIGLPGAPTGGH
jgi:periplasmic nitrate reductase NapE